MTDRVFKRERDAAKEAGKSPAKSDVVRRSRNAGGKFFQVFERALEQETQA